MEQIFIFFFPPRRGNASNARTVDSDPHRGEFRRCPSSARRLLHSAIRAGLVCCCKLLRCLMVVAGRSSRWLASRSFRKGWWAEGGQACCWR